MNSPGFGDLSPTCSFGFYLDDGIARTNTCRPECGKFLRAPLVRLFFERLSIVIGIIASVMVFIIAGTVERKKL